MTPTSDELKRHGYAADALLRDEQVAAWLKDEPDRLLKRLMTELDRGKWEEIVADARAIQRLHGMLQLVKQAGEQAQAKEKRNG